MEDSNMHKYLDQYTNKVTPLVEKVGKALDLDTGSLESEKLALNRFEDELDRHHIISHRTRRKDADVFRFLRTQILQAMDKHGLKTIAISSPRYGDGKSTTAINLAVSISQDLKQTVLLVDLDLRKPSLEGYLNLTVNRGLTDYLQEKASVADCLIRLPFERLSVFPAGKPIDASSETLGSPEMGKLASELKSRYDDRIIIYDMPPLLEQDDPLVFLPHVDSVLLIAREGVTTAQELKRSLDILQSAKIIGVVLNAA